MDSFNDCLLQVSGFSEHPQRLTTVWRTSKKPSMDSREGSTPKCSKYVWNSNTKVPATIAQALNGENLGILLGRRSYNVFARNFDVPDLLCASRKLHSKQGFINSQGKIYPCSKTNLWFGRIVFVPGEKGIVNIIWKYCLHEKLCLKEIIISNRLSLANNTFLWWIHNVLNPFEVCMFRRSWQITNNGKAWF